MSAASAPVVLPESTVTVTLATADALHAGHQMRSMARGDRCGSYEDNELFARVGGQLTAAARTSATSAGETVEAPALTAPRGPRVCITGGPKTGKTTLARKLLVQLMRERPGAHVYHTDDLMDLDWSAVSQHVVDHWFPQPGPWVLEGVAVSRALRKWRDQHPAEAPPVDRVIYLLEPHEQLTPRQGGMASSVATVHGQIEAWLAVHGIKTERMSTTMPPAADELAPSARNVEVR